MTILLTELWTTVNIRFLRPPVDTVIPTSSSHQFDEQHKTFSLVCPPCHLCWWGRRLSQCSLAGLFSSVTWAWLCKSHLAGSCLPAIPIYLWAGCSCTGRVAMSCSAMACLSLWAQSAPLCEGTELVTAPEAFWWHGELWSCAQVPLELLGITFQQAGAQAEPSHDPSHYCLLIPAFQTQQEL